jgi:hypothetical protein
MPIRSHEDEPTAPAIPSFASLRGTRGRSAVDLLVPGPVPVQAPPAAGPAPRPAEYADLLRLGLRLARAAAGAPRRVARWTVARPAGCARRLLGS